MKGVLKMSEKVWDSKVGEYGVVTYDNKRYVLIEPPHRFEMECGYTYCMAKAHLEFEPATKVIIRWEFPDGSQKPKYMELLGYWRWVFNPEWRDKSKLPDLNEVKSVSRIKE